jgi:hypothetical protein
MEIQALHLRNLLLTIGQELLKSAKIISQRIYPIWTRQPSSTSRQPKKKLAFSIMDGIKQDEKRITLDMCCNSNGMEKLPSLCIGQSAKARCFAGHSLSSKGFCMETTRQPGCQERYLQLS